MKMKYDPKTDSVFIELAVGKYDKSKKISESILVDEDSSGKILGIEILDAKRNIRSFNPKKLNITLQAT